MTFDEYRGIRAVNWSSLKHMRKSPKHYRYEKMVEDMSTRAMDIGTAVHCAVLTPDRFAIELHVVDVGARTAKAYKDAVIANPTRLVILEHEHKATLRMRDAILNHEVASKYLSKGQAEVTLQWTDPETLMDCKGRADFLSDYMPALLDIKTTVDADKYKFGMVASRMGYLGQMAFYSRGLKANKRHVDERLLIAVESKPPHDVVVYEVTEDLLYFGDKQVSELMSQLHLCETHDHWAGLSDGIEELWLPARDTPHEGDEDE